jgi:glycosyltransferase involved in cell wall biosynthesis
VVPPDAIKVSVYTPTDNDKFLEDCYNSLVSQDYPYWEWIVVPNGAATESKFIAQLKDSDARVIVRDFPLESSSIGTLKKFAVHSCSGQLYVELDHDDMLTSDALSEIVAAYNQTDAGFLYSDFVAFTEDHLSITYSEELGWSSYPFEFQGRAYKASKTFEPTPDALHRLIYTPNHVRAWSKTAYDAAGGYDSAYEVCDDFDLITRTYLAQVPFHRIDKCLYMYRQWDGSRSVAAHVNSRNEEIQRVAGDIAHLRTHQLVEEHCRRNDFRVVNVAIYGDGRSIGFTDLDDLPDDSVGWLRVDNVFQFIAGGHVADWVNKAWSKLIHGGWLSVSVPSTEGQGAFQNPTYKSYWNSGSFQHFTSPATGANLVSSTEYNAKYHIARCWSHVSEPPSNILGYCVNADLIAIKNNGRIAGTKP